MAATTSQRAAMENIVRSIRSDHPQFRFVAGTTACWSPLDNEVRYNLTAPHGIAGLLHELAHALLSHQTYHTDLDLVHKEVAAWDRALELADRYDITIDAEHIQDCLDTYRDWVHKRSTCPGCRTNGLQTSSQQYNCLNCGRQWHVSNSRFCRAYRRSATTEKSREHVPALSRFI